MSTLKLHICKDCAMPDIAGLQAILDQSLPGQVTVHSAPCLDLCHAPVAMSLQRKGAAGYVFSGVQVNKDAADIAATCRAYLESPDGWIDDARPCGRLRFCLAARLPA